MPTKEISIKTIKEKEKHTLVISSTDEMYNVFDKEIAGKLQEGMLISIEYSVKEVGDKTFNNLTSFVELGRKEPETEKVADAIKEEIANKPEEETPDTVPGTSDIIVTQTVALLVAIKSAVEIEFRTTIKENPEIIPCVNSVFIEANKRIRG